MDYGQPVRFGVFLTPDATQPSRLLELAILADELGFELIGVQDHPYQRRFLDTWTLLTAIAMRTKTVQVFPDVANLPLRPPAILAKAAASLDLLSGGRLGLGLGAGGAWEAIKAIGGPVRTPGESVSALEEAIQVIRLMWSGERGVRFDGKFYQLAGVQTGPKPMHPIGIWLGAYRPRMLSLVGRLADGWVPSLGYVQPADLLEGNRRIDEAAAAAGREPRAIRRLLNAGADVPVEMFTSLTVEQGMDTYVIGGIEDPEALRWFATDVVPAVREAVARAR
ncbi:MAG TPA: LLM class flavin-dependent oxidoreductase [Verrucomicrobiae bacterium]|jgi:alkanesulfonate monooxygenase SsuD/methylene tetrahydromethanopterin reductase-like flavin-dependent oxidoreductase (luciferase family)|nr:LLM class flavin-dependent oxidoreductase [Verrucomicrobiae bacterium]